MVDMSSASSILGGAPPPAHWPCRYVFGDDGVITLLWFAYDAETDSYSARVSALDVIADFWGVTLSLVQGPRPDAPTLIEVMADLDGARKYETSTNEIAQLWSRRAA